MAAVHRDKEALPPLPPASSSSTASTTTTSPPPSSEGYTVSAFLPSMLTDLVQSAAELVQQASEMVQHASEIVVGPPAPVAKEAPPVPERTNTGSSAQDAAPRQLPGCLGVEGQDTTPKASRVVSSADTGTIKAVQNTAAAVAAAAASETSQRASALLGSLTSTLLGLAPNLSAEPESSESSTSATAAGGAVTSPSPLSPGLASGRWDGLPLRTSSPSPSVSSSVSRQLTADGVPFSSDPLISAMQRIPDGPSSPPPSSAYSLQKSETFSSLSSVSTLETDTDGVERCTACSCKRSCKTWSVELPASSSTSSLSSSSSKTGGEEKENKRLSKADEWEGDKPHTCPCTHHQTKLRKRSSSSRHFHRVEQLVRGTKRVTRDIRNVL